MRTLNSFIRDDNNEKLLEIVENLELRGFNFIVYGEELVFFSESSDYIKEFMNSSIEYLIVTRLGSEHPILIDKRYVNFVFLGDDLECIMLTDV